MIINIKYLFLKQLKNVQTLKYKTTFISPSLGLDSSKHFLRIACIVDKLTENRINVFRIKIL